MLNTEITLGSYLKSIELSHIQVNNRVILQFHYLLIKFCRL
jgi:hypothetical protein